MVNHTRPDLGIPRLHSISKCSNLELIIAAFIKAFKPDLIAKVLHVNFSKFDIWAILVQYCRKFIGKFNWVIRNYWCDYFLHLGWNTSNSHGSDYHWHTHRQSLDKLN